jgi:hypothetical protein
MKERKGLKDIKERNHIFLSRMEKLHYELEDRYASQQHLDTLLKACEKSWEILRSDVEKLMSDMRNHIDGLRSSVRSHPKVTDKPPAPAPGSIPRNKEEDEEEACKRGPC